VFPNWICAISKDAIGEVRNFVSFVETAERFVLNIQKKLES